MILLSSPFHRLQKLETHSSFWPTSAIQYSYHRRKLHSTTLTLQISRTVWEKERPERYSSRFPRNTLEVVTTKQEQESILELCQKFASRPVRGHRSQMRRVYTEWNAYNEMAVISSRCIRTSEEGQRERKRERTKKNSFSYQYEKDEKRIRSSCALQK